MTRRAGVLDAIEPEPMASFHPLDLDGFGVKSGEVVTVASRRGSISLYARADAGTPRGAVFIPFCYYEAAANRPTKAVDVYIGQVHEYNYCSRSVNKGSAG